VRLIAATNRSIEDDARAGKFREDLLFRLNVVTLVIPPLRERPEDVRALAQHYLAHAAARQHRPAFEFSEAAARAIAAHAWPGNLREPEAAVDLAKTIELPVGVRSRRLLPRIVPIPGRRGAVLVLSDVTELARLDEMRLELVAVASHELRTPLTTMRMTLSMLEERAASYDARARDLVATAMLGVEQLSVLVNEFLDLTQIEAGQLRLQWMRISVREVVEQAAKAIAPSCEQARIALELEPAPAPPVSIDGDRARLVMVVSNLLSNAVKYTPPGGRIAVRTAVDADRRLASIEVSDTGPGIPAEYRERVFERFFRIEHARKSELASAGVGIGLYIARQVIEAHGGAIRCDAGPLGGARFVVTVPLDSEARLAADRA